MKQKKQPRSLRSRLLTVILLCWVLPILIVAALAGFLLSSSYESSTRQRMESTAQNALDQIRMRMESVVEDSNGVSYDGVVRSAYRSYQLDGDTAALYRAVSEYLAQAYRRNEKIPATFISFWEESDVQPYVSRGSNMSYNVNRVYRDEVEQKLLERMSGGETGVFLLEYGGELYAARNLLDSRLKPYATVAMLCDKDFLFQSLDAVRLIGGASLTIDGSLLLDCEGNLSTLSPGQEAERGDMEFTAEASGHSFRMDAVIAPFDFWKDTPQIRTAAAAVALMVLPLLLAMLVWFRHFVTKPIETLAEAEERLSSGERGYHIEQQAASGEFQTLYDHFNYMSEELKNQFERSYLEQQALQRAKIKALQSQINPHFLNNTLEIINWEARIAGNERVVKMIEALSVMLDAALDRDGRARIHLREEIGYSDAYLYIIKERLGERLEVIKEVDEALLDEMVPRLLLQPIVENAVEHDITPRRGGRLSVRAYREGERMVLEVEHDGSMTEEDRRTIRAVLEEPADDGHDQSQVGLRNVNQRLRLMYGERAAFTVEQHKADTILARLAFPVGD